MDELINKNFDIDYPEDGGQYVGNMYDIYKKGFESGRKLGFDQGYTCACATMVNEHGESTMVQDCYKNNFHTVKQLKGLGIEAWEIEKLKSTIKEIERKRNINP